LRTLLIRYALITTRKSLIILAFLYIKSLDEINVTNISGARDRFHGSRTAIGRPRRSKSRLTVIVTTLFLALRNF
jgi:hypothetical protein